MGVVVVVLSDNVLLGLARDPRVRAVLPAFRTLYQSLIRGGGGCRCRKKQGNVGGGLASLKYAIASDPGLAAKVKVFVKAQHIVVHVRQGNQLVRKEL